jgi:hypothetical protein
MAKITLKQKLENARAQLAQLPIIIAELEARVANEFDPADLQEGERVEVNYGRAGKINVLEGKVLGVKSPEGKGSTFIVVQVGSGADTEVIKVVPKQVLRRLDLVTDTASEDETLAS